MSATPVIAPEPAFRVAVVLPAGGSGLRIGTPTPKQVWEGTALLCRNGQNDPRQSV